MEIRITLHSNTYNWVIIGISTNGPTFHNIHLHRPSSVDIPVMYYYSVKTFKSKLPAFAHPPDDEAYCFANAVVHPPMNV